MAISDVYFSIGRTHAICQDYGLADYPGKTFESCPYAYGIVSDGCSSSPHTDWGSRFLARAASECRGESLDPHQIIQKADTYRQILGLPESSLDATLLICEETPSKDVRVRLFGDGVVAARRRDGTVEHWVREYTHNAPAYLSYLLSPSRLEQYVALDGKQTMTGEEPVPAHPESVYSRTFSWEEYDVVLVGTDGALSFQKRVGTGYTPVPIEDVLAQVFRFKTLTSGFLTRRLQRFFKKFCVDAGWHHTDDFAMAGIVLEKP